MTSHERAARNFLRETQFHLGDLITEQPHGKTADLSRTISESIAAGLDQLLSVDEDILPKAGEVFRSSPYGELKSALERVVLDGNTLYFSGCGSTGRLAILLETLWRRYWFGLAEEHPALSDTFKARGERSCSIMTGGDRALIRSVENFEDYAELGRRQSRDRGVSEGDLFIAVSEGGETSSVIGTALEAADRGARVFFLYNNPDKVLKARVERSRRLIEDPRVTTLNLTTGPMALSGSTRMQATTMELFVLAAALEGVCSSLAARDTGAVNPDHSPGREEKYLESYADLLSQLRSGDNLSALARIVSFEEDVYSRGGLVTYVADTYLLDIFSDTTERSPTFMLPPFRKRDDPEAPQSWAFAKDPLRPTREAWDHLLLRTPRGLDWTSRDYREMSSPQSLIDRPPKLDLEEILSYPIGSEEDREREEKGALVFFDLFDGRSSQNRKAMVDYFQDHRSRYARGALTVTVGPVRREGDVHISLNPPRTEMFSLWHLFFKIMINAVSTGTMARMGRIRGNWMIQVDATNKKLVDRSCRIISALTGVGYEEACHVLHKVMAQYEKESRRDNRSFVLLAIEQIENRD